MNEGNVELPEDSDHSVSSDEEQYPERLLAVTITVTAAVSVSVQAG